MSGRFILRLILWLLWVRYSTYYLVSSWLVICPKMEKKPFTFFFIEVFLCSFPYTQPFSVPTVCTQRSKLYWWMHEAIKLFFLMDGKKTFLIITLSSEMRWITKFQDNLTIGVGYKLTCKFQSKQAN